MVALRQASVSSTSPAARARQRGARNTTFQRFDAEAMSLEEADFDAAICALRLMYFPDPVKALGELFLSNGWRSRSLSSPTEALYAAFRGGSPSRSPTAAWTARPQRRCNAEYLHYIESFREGTGYRIPGELVTAVGVRPLP
jgi:hypothetical protein